MAKLKKTSELRIFVGLLGTLTNNREVIEPDELGRKIHGGTQVSDFYFPLICADH